MENVENHNTDLKFTICKESKITVEQFDDMFNKNIEELKKYSDVEAAIKQGASNITHTYNAQKAFHHRDVGIVGASLLIDEYSSNTKSDSELL